VVWLPAVGGMGLL